MGFRQLAQYAARATGLSGSTVGLDRPFLSAGAPTNGASGTYVGRAVPGSLLINTTNAKLYMATAATTGTTVTWTVVGTQT